MDEKKTLLFSVTIDDCEVQTFRSGGKGGQNQNKVSSGVRIIHRQSGARGEARDSRDQLVNKRSAFERMAASEVFKKWHKAEVARRLGLSAKAEELVEESLSDPKSLRVEYKDDDGRWIVVP